MSPSNGNKPGGCLCAVVRCYRTVEAPMQPQELERRLPVDIQNVKYVAVYKGLNSEAVVVRGSVWTKRLEAARPRLP